MDFSAPDLTAHPPRSPRVRLGGYVILPRLLDKCRAEIADKNGDYHYACPLDMRWFEFVGIDPIDLKGEVASGASDSEVLKWIRINAKNNPSVLEIEAWSRHQEQRAPGDPEYREFFNRIHREAAPHRQDIHTTFDLLDLDDYVSFGGKA